MTMETTIESKLKAGLAPEILTIENESYMHSGPATESHFKVTAVASAFEGLSLVKRHQQVYGILTEELAGPVHALALHLYSPSEWEVRNQAVPNSPNCRGGSGTTSG